MTSGDSAEAYADELAPESLGLRMAAVEVERHAAESGWDQPPRLFALARTADLVAAEPVLAAELGLSVGDSLLDSGPEAAASAAELFTPIEQELEDESQPIVELLAYIEWPETVDGVVAVVERLVLPPDAEHRLPDNPTDVATYAAEHAGPEEVRVAAAVLRNGAAHCVIRMRSHDDDDALLHGRDLAPGLVAALRETLEP